MKVAGLACSNRTGGHSSARSGGYSEMTSSLLNYCSGSSDCSAGLPRVCW